MPTCVTSDGRVVNEFPDMTVREARSTGNMPAKWVAIKKDEDGISRQLGNDEMMEGFVPVVPNNTPGAP